MKNLNAAKPIKKSTIYKFENKFYEPLEKISEYPQKLYLTSSIINVEKIYIVKEIEEVMVESIDFFYVDGFPHSKTNIVRATLVDIIQVAKEKNGRFAVPIMTYKLGHIFEDGSVVTKVSSRWKQKKTGKYLEYIYMDFRKIKTTFC